jgi:hypothetical protein
MRDRYHDTPNMPGERPLDRLLCDLRALGRWEPDRPPARERLAAVLGNDLVAALRAELDRVDFAGSPLSRRPRRVA